MRLINLFIKKRSATDIYIQKKALILFTDNYRLAVHNNNCKIPPTLQFPLPGHALVIGKTYRLPQINACYFYNCHLQENTVLDYHHFCLFNYKRYRASNENQTI